MTIFYDFEKDPHEMKSVFGDPAYSAIQEKLHQRLVEIRLQYGDSDEISKQLLGTYLRNLKK